MPTTNNTEATKRNSSASWIVIIIGLLMIFGGAYSYLSSTDSASDKPLTQQPLQPEKTVSISAPAKLNNQPPEAIKVAESVEQAEQPVTEPLVKESSTAKPVNKLPSLDNSDSLALSSAQQLSSSSYQSLLIPQDIIRNFVVFIDNFARGELLANFSPLIKPNERFSVLKADKQMYLNPESYQRYDLYADMIAAIDVDSAIRQYRKLKPLFAQAYQEIGYSELSFTDTLDDAIDEVLNTPVIKEPIALVAPSAMYKFADPQLEALSDTQKLIIRMGPDNTLKLKNKLQQIQQALQAL